MRFVSYSDLRKHLKDHPDAVCRDRQALVVTRRNDDHVVVISMDEYRSLAETEYCCRKRRTHATCATRSARLAAAPRALSDE